uniref:OPA3-like protein n=1 Tax=Strigamia maritima TaxID=126957 RepID=T1J5X6_STRMM
MAHAFPAAKLLILVVRQISKPIANRVKQRAKNSQFFRNYIIMPPAQLYHWMEVRWKMRMLNFGNPEQVPKLNEQMAIELGAELLSEGILMLVGVACLLAEYYRSSRKEAAKEAEKQRILNELENRLYELEYIVTEQEAQLRQFSRRKMPLFKPPWIPRVSPEQSKSLPNINQIDGQKESPEKENSEETKPGLKVGVITHALKGLQSTFKSFLDGFVNDCLIKSASIILCALLKLSKFKMAPIFPLLKMAVLFTTRIARPFYVIIMRTTKLSKPFTRYVVMPPAQIYHWWDVRWRMQTLDLRKPYNISRLSDVEATELGAAILSEGLVFTVGTTFLVTEMYRQNKIATKILEEEAAKKQETEDRLNSLEELVSQQGVLLEELSSKRISFKKSAKPKPPGTAKSTSNITTTFYQEKETKEDGLLVRMLQALGNHI